jgi:hypothetical protein
MGIKQKWHQAEYKPSNDHKNISVSISLQSVHEIAYGLTCAVFKVFFT